MPRGVPKIMLSEEEKKRRKKEANRIYYIEKKQCVPKKRPPSIICACGGSFKINRQLKHEMTIKHTIYEYEKIILQSLYGNHSRDESVELLNKIYDKNMLFHNNSKIVWLKQYIQSIVDGGDINNMPSAYYTYATEMKNDASIDVETKEIDLF